MSAERGDALVAPRCPGGEYSLIPSLCTSLLGSSKTQMAQNVPFCSGGVPWGFPSWDCRCPPHHTAPIPCCLQWVCIQHDASAGLLQKRGGVYQLQCVWWACSRHLAADKVCISCSAWKGFAAIPFLVTGLHSPWCMQWGFVSIPLLVISLHLP